MIDVKFSVDEFGELHSYDFKGREVFLYKVSKSKEAMLPVYMESVKSVTVIARSENEAKGIALNSYLHNYLDGMCTKENIIVAKIPYHEFFKVGNIPFVEY